MIKINEKDGGIELKGDAVELGKMVYQILRGKGVCEQ